LAGSRPATHPLAPISKTGPRDRTTNPVEQRAIRSFAPARAPKIPDKQTLVEEIAAWQHDRNANHTKANWHFSTSNARIKLKHLYPSI